jgi:hypothetical protein
MSATPDHAAAPSFNLAAHILAKRLSPPQGHAWLFWRDADGALSIRAGALDAMPTMPVRGSA